MSLKYRGVNLASYAFDEAPPFEYGKTYVMPGFDVQTGTVWNGGSLDYFVSKGMNCFPLQFQWELAQPSDYGELDETYMGRIDRFIDECAKRNVTVVLTPHNFAKRYGKPMNVDQCMGLWSYMADRYGNKPNVLFDLMCEPAAIKVEAWVGIVNKVALLLRARGYNRPIIICLGGYAGARSFNETWYGEKSSTALLRITDKNVIFNVHQYNDENWSGEFPNGETTNDPKADLLTLTTWARTNGKKLWLGEFGAPNTARSRVAIADTLLVLDMHSDVWQGFAWWAAGPWFKGYKLSIEPEGGVDKPQMAWLAPYLVAPAPEKTEAEKLATWVKAELATIRTSRVAQAALTRELVTALDEDIDDLTQMSNEVDSKAWLK